MVLAGYFHSSGFRSWADNVFDNLRGHSREEEEGEKGGVVQ